MINNNIFMEQLNKYYTVWQECNNVYEEWAKAHGLSMNSLLIFFSIQEDKQNCTQKAISQKWLIPKQTVNMILKDFEKRGLIELITMQKDKRNKLIQFTTEGKEYADSIISELRKVELFVIEKIGIERMKQLNDTNALFVELFKRAGGKNV